MDRSVGVIVFGGGTLVCNMIVEPNSAELMPVKAVTHCCYEYSNRLDNNCKYIDRDNGKLEVSNGCNVVTGGT
jgi:hypothetical protein